MAKTPASLVISSRVPEPRDPRRDAAILRRLVDGDPKALADLYDLYAASLFRHGLALTGRHADAEDLVQTVFLKLATTGAPLLAVRHAPNYLHRILRAAWLDVRKRPAASLEQPADMTVDLVAADGPNVTEMAIDVASALARLPAVQREVVALHLGEGFSFREAGRMTGVSMFTAASRYRAALRQLRQLMGRR
jgi:RNA polymerase sigma-70 factor, ECF subfamily